MRSQIHYQNATSMESEAVSEILDVLEERYQLSQWVLRVVGGGTDPDCLRASSSTVKLIGVLDMFV